MFPLSTTFNCCYFREYCLRGEKIRKDQGEDKKGEELLPKKKVEKVNVFSALSDDENHKEKLLPLLGRSANRCLFLASGD